MNKTGKVVLHLCLALAITSIAIVGDLEYWFRDPYYIYILAALSWITMIFHWYLKRYFLHGTVLLVALVSGIYGFWQYNNLSPFHSFANSLYTTLRLFLLDLDPEFTHVDGEFTRLPLALEIARWTAASYTILAVGQFIVKYFGISLKGELYRILGGHIIIFGYNDESAKLITNLKTEKYRILVIDDDLTKEQKQDLFEIGVPFIEAVYNKSNLMERSGLKKVDRVILYYKDDFKNLETYLSIRAKAHFKKRKNIPVQLHLDYAKSRQVYKSLQKEEKDNIKSYFFSASQLIAEKVLQDNPLYEGYEAQLRKEDGEPLHLLFIGFGTRNQELAFHALNLGHFLTRRKMRFTILDQDIKKVKKEWSYLAKNASDYADITFKEVDVLRESLKPVLSRVETPITHVYFSIRDDFLDTIEGLELLEALPQVPIFLRMSEDYKISNWLHNHQGEFRHVKMYATLKDVLNSEYVLNEIQTNIAKMAHENYRKIRVENNLDPGQSWEELGAFKQESTRFQMLHNDTKLMLLGLKKVKRDDPNYAGKVLDEEHYQEYIKPYIEKVAKVEKNRWNAFHFLRGWQLADANTKLTKAELEKRHLHKSLIPWEELDEKTKSYDIDNVKQLQLYYKAQDYDLMIDDSTRI